MIISGIQTGNTRWLAAHLQNAADNETIDIAQVTGTVATDIDGALAEFDAIASGTKAAESVYAAFINPPVPLTRAQYARAIAHIEAMLGLAGQPRIVLFHIKKGREHCHIVWSRIDATFMRAIHLSHDRQKLRRCAQELAAEFGTELPPGLAQDRGSDRFLERRGPSRAEKAMEASSGLSREERSALITDCYRSSDSPEAFINALEAAGFILARGDRRALVVVDIAGEIHSLARQIDGARASDIKKKLEGLNLSLLPPAERAKLLMQQRAVAQHDAMRAHRKKEEQADTEHTRLTGLQAKRRLDLDRRWQVMKVRHMHEWKVLLAHIRAQEDKRITQRHWLAAGLAAYMRKIIFLRDLVTYYEKRARRTMEEQHAQLMASVKRRHENEVAELQRFYDALSRLSRRELFVFAQNRQGTAASKGPASEVLSGIVIRSGTHIAKVRISVPMMHALERDIGEVEQGLIAFRINVKDVTDAGALTVAPMPEVQFHNKRGDDSPVPTFSSSSWGLNLGGPEIKLSGMSGQSNILGAGHSVGGVYVNFNFKDVPKPE